MKKEEDSDPGASRHGNFINYYKFHPAEERVRQLPRGVWQLKRQQRKYTVLDVGCNAGELTIELHNFLTEQLPDAEIHVLGIDLDPILIERSEEITKNPSVTFKCLDFFAEERETILSTYLNNLEVPAFDVIFCFSITMWIHLNHGDEGLIKFLEDICRVTRRLVIEPQPWKCYKNASRRLRKRGEADFPLINKLKLTGDMEKHVEDIVCGEKCNFTRLIVTENNTWGRKIMIFDRKST